MVQDLERHSTILCFISPNLM